MGKQEVTQAYLTKVLDELEIVHAENIYIMQLISALTGDNDAIDSMVKLTDEWDRKFDEIRKRW